MLYRILNRTYCRWCPDKVSCLARNQCYHRNFWFRILMVGTTIIPAIAIFALAMFKYTRLAFIFWGVLVATVMLDIFYVLPKIRP